MNQPTREHQILEWANSTFGPRTISSITNKLFEETGEIAGQVNRLLEGRITSYDTVRDEMGDSLIVLSQMAALFNTTLEEILTKRLAVVQGRHPEPATPPFYPCALRPLVPFKPNNEERKAFEEAVKLRTQQLPPDVSPVIAMFCPFPVAVVRETSAIPTLKIGDEGICHETRCGLLKVKFNHLGLDVFLDPDIVVHATAPQYHLTPPERVS